MYMETFQKYESFEGYLFFKREEEMQQVLKKIEKEKTKYSIFAKEKGALSETKIQKYQNLDYKIKGR